MNRLLAAMFLIFTVSSGLIGQEHTPDLLVHAAQCLTAKDFLPRTKATVLSFGYLLDAKSYPGEKVLYIVHYTSTDRSKGMAFSVFLSQEQGRQAFNVQNNAIFVRTKDGVEFTKHGDPLGGYLDAATPCISHQKD